MKVLLEVFELLNSETHYALLRNYELLPAKLDSRDIDILIDKKEYNNVASELMKVLLNHGYRIVMYYRSHRFNTIIVGKQNKGSIGFITNLTFSFQYLLLVM